jgi:hypothetical protein
MGNCGYCKTFVIAGGVRDHGRVYCNKDCHYYGCVKENAKLVPDELIESEVRAVFDGKCPRCEGDGPIDLFHSHYVWSAFLFSVHSSPQALSCRTCARHRQFRAAFYCAALGWWSLSGLILTPAYVVFNFYEAAKGTKAEPSQALRLLISRQIAATAMWNMEQDKQPPKE